MNNEYLYSYVDGVGSLRMVDGVVRVDLVVITEIEGDQMKANRVGGLAMSISAAVKLRDQLSSMIEDLKGKGVIQSPEIKNS
jgi:hypothetical protein